jgi:uncharacterized protein (DUF362 family)
MIKRRDFIKGAAAVGTAAAINPFRTLSAIARDTNYFAINTFIENNPDAVFIMETFVEDKYSVEAIKSAGLDFGRTVFVSTDNPDLGFPLDGIFNIKPNLTSRGWWQSGYTVDGTMGVITDVNFVEGVIEGMKELGVTAGNIHLREVNGTENLTDGGYAAMGERTGSNIQIINTPIGEISEELVHWKDVSDGVYFNRIPFLSPVNTPDSILLNISKFKTHSMGLTLCAKNIQGTIVANYQQHCRAYNTPMSIDSDHVQSDTWATIKDNYDRHVADSIPRWDTPGEDASSGIGMETWTSRCLDNNAVTNAQLNIIEGIYGRDGDFVEGPHDGFAEDFMTNILIFGKNAIHVDIIGHWLAGHEPGNFGFFHIARERGFSTFLNPMDIPVYDWKSDGSAILTPLTDFHRTPLLTNYLWQEDEEELYHMVDAPFDYLTSVDRHYRVKGPETYKLHQNYPNPFNPSTTIQYNLSQSGQVRLDIFNNRGQIVDILVNESQRQGSHMVIWKAKNLPSGNYFYRLMTEGFKETKRMVLLR